MKIKINSQPLIDWMVERHLIYLRKSFLEKKVIPEWANKNDTEISKDWNLNNLTSDKIMSTYKFCNVFRELDAVTEWIRINIREPYADHPDLFIMLAIARYINWPPTLKYLMSIGNAWPGDSAFSFENLGDGIEAWGNSGNKVWTGAYIIWNASRKSDFHSMGKAHYIPAIVIKRLSDNIKEWNTLFESKNITLEEIWKNFKKPYYLGWGPFMAYEIVTDLRHTRYLDSAIDIKTWASVGPGSKHGLNRLMGKPLNSGITQDDACIIMQYLLDEVSTKLPDWFPELEMRDIEHSLCETDKWLRVKNNEGRPRSKYKNNTIKLF